MRPQNSSEKDTVPQRRRSIQRGIQSLIRLCSRIIHPRPGPASACGVAQRRKGDRNASSAAHEKAVVPKDARARPPDLSSLLRSCYTRRFLPLLSFLCAITRPMRGRLQAICGDRLAREYTHARVSQLLGGCPLIGRYWGLAFASSLPGNINIPQLMARLIIGRENYCGSSIKIDRQLNISASRYSEHYE